MAGMDWFRWHHGAVNDPKFQLVARKSGASVAEVIAVWATILEAASQADQRGNHGDLDFEAIDCALGLTDGKAQAIYTHMGARNLVDVDAQKISAWDKRQPLRERDDGHGRPQQGKSRPKQTDATDSESHTEPVAATQSQSQPPATNNNQPKPVATNRNQSQPSAAKKSLEEIRGDKSITKEVTLSLSSRGASAVDNFNPGAEAGEVCAALEAAGLPSVSPMHPELLALIGKGVAVETFSDAAKKSVSKGKGFAYMAAIVAGQLQAAAGIVAGPSGVEIRWDESRKTVEEMAVRLGVGKWDEMAVINREPYTAYVARVRKAMDVQGATA